MVGNLPVAIPKLNVASVNVLLRDLQSQFITVGLDLLGRADVALSVHEVRSITGLEIR
jgi:hypothetical protein